MKVKVTILIIGLWFVSINASWSASPGDVNLDGRIGMEEVIHALQVNAGIRSDAQVDTRTFFEKTRTAEILNSFAGWTSDTRAQIGDNGSSSTVALSGVDNGANLSIGKFFSNPNPAGIVGIIKISAINGYASGGFGMYIGSLDGKNVQVIMSLVNYPQQGVYPTITYEIRLVDSSLNVVTIAFGHLAVVSSPIGKDIKMGFARIGNEIWLYSDVSPLMRWEPSTTIGSRLNTDWDDWVWYWEWAGDKTSNITAIFKNIKMIYKP